MKTPGIQKSVRQLGQGREIGEAPSLGRVSRMPGTGLPKGERRMRKRGQGSRGSRARKNRKLVLMTWSVVIIGLVVLALSATLWMWGKNQLAQSAIVAKRAAAKEVIIDRVKSRFPSPSEEDALLLVRHALAVRDPTEVEALIRPGSASTQQVVDFLKTMEERDGKVTQSSWLSSMDANGLLLDGVLVLSEKDGQTRNRLALLTPDEKGSWRVDFDAFARTVNPSWKEILNLKSGKALVRVILANDSYYNGLYQDEGTWMCFGMVSPDSEAVLLGYCRRGTPQAQALTRILKADSSGADQMREQKLNRATLEITHTPNAESRQFEITRVFAEDWVRSSSPFDESFDAAKQAPPK